MVCLYIGGICLCKFTVGIVQGSPHLSLLKHFQGERRRVTAHLLFPRADREEGGFFYPGIWLLGSSTAQCSVSGCLSDMHTHTHTASGWALIWLWLETGGSGEGGEGGSHLLHRTGGGATQKQDGNPDRRRRMWSCSMLQKHKKKVEWE